MALREWVRLPSKWIEDGELKKLTWSLGVGADNVAALMALTAIAHHANEETGLARLTYTDIVAITGLSRAKLAGGLDVLEGLNVVKRGASGRSTLQLANYDPKGGWAKLPAKGLYAGGRMRAFDDFHLRSPVELYALKLYFLFVARRGNDTNMANISYTKIAQYTDVLRNRIRAGVSLLVNANLVHVEHLPSDASEHGVAAAYRLTYLETRLHMGTRGRGMDLFAETAE